jgi:hypothetical protein
MQSTPNSKIKMTVPITREHVRESADGVEKYVIEGVAETAMRSMDAASL